MRVLLSLLIDAVDGLESTQTHGRIDIFVSGSAKDMWSCNVRVLTVR